MAEGERSYHNALNLAFPVPTIAKHSIQGRKIKNKCDQAERLQPQNVFLAAMFELMPIQSLFVHNHMQQSFIMKIAYVKQT